MKGGAGDGKKKLFGGMKIKGPVVKPQQQKQHVSQSETNLSFETREQAKQQEFVSKNQTTEDMPSTPVIQKQQIKSSQQNPKKQHNKMSINQSRNWQSGTNRPIPATSYQHQQSIGSGKNIIEQNKVKNSSQEQQMRRDTKSRSEKDYEEESQDNKSIKQDRSVIVGYFRGEQERDQLQFRKRKPSGNNVQKSNPFLSQIKKTTAVLKSKQQVVQQQRIKRKYTMAQQVVQEQKRKQMIAPVQLKLRKPSSSVSALTPCKQINQKSKKQRETVLQQLASSHLKILQNLSKKRQAKQHIIHLSTHTSELKQELSVLINKQNQYITTQQYDQADRFQSKIQQTQAKIDQEQMEMGFTQEQFYKIQYDSLEIRRNYFDQEKRIMRRLKLVELDLEDDMAQFKRAEEGNIENEKMLNENQKKKISRIVSDIKSQSEQLLKYQKTFYEDLNSRRKPLEQLLREQQSKKVVLQQQIKQLEQKLKKKRNLAKGTLSSIQSTKQKISQVDHTFQEQRYKLKQRKQNLSELQSQKSSLSNKLRLMQEQITVLQKNKVLNLHKMQKQKGSLGNISAKIQKFMVSLDLDDYLQAKRTKIDTFICNSKQLKSFQQKHKQKKQLVKQLEFKKSNILSELTKKQQLIKQLKLRIPKLETEQKQMSMAKNFKGAGMKKSQIKECNDEIVQIRKQVQNTYADEAEIDAQIEEINTQQQQYLEEENEIRENLAISQYKLAIQKKQQLLNQIQWLKDLQNTKVNKKYQPLLKQQLQSLLEEISYIAQQYGLSQNINQGQNQATQNQQKSSQKSSHKSPQNSQQTIKREQYKTTQLPGNLNQAENNQQQHQDRQQQQQQHLQLQKGNQIQRKNDVELSDQAQQPDYQPPALFVNEDSQENDQEQHNDQQGDNDHDQSVEHQQDSSESQHEHQQNQRESHQHSQEKSQEKQDKDADHGYVPLQLD